MENSTSVSIPENILNEIYIQALNEFPNECCGWLVGPNWGRGQPRFTSPS